MKKLVLVYILAGVLALAGCADGDGPTSILFTKIDEDSPSRQPLNVIIPEDEEEDEKIKVEKEENQEPEEESPVEEDFDDLEDQDGDEEGEESEEDELSEDEEDTPYKEVLDRIYDHLLTSYEGVEDASEFGEFGIKEEADYGSNARGLALTGYVVTDISGDGVAELLIGSSLQNPSDIYDGNSIYAVYTMQDDEPVLCFQGSAKDRYTYMGFGQFINQASDEQGNSLATYSISKDGTELVCDECYFSEIKDEEGLDVHYYHNKDGSRDTLLSEELRIDAESFDRLSSAMMIQAKWLQLSIFTGYREDSPIADASELFLGTPEDETIKAGTVLARWERDVDNLSSAYEFNADNGGGRASVVFSSSGNVNEFKICSISLLNVDEDGTMTFSEYPVYEGTLTREHPLKVGMSFDGDIPNYGISYIDGNGNRVHFALSISGENGSLLLTGIKIR